MMSPYFTVFVDFFYGNLWRVSSLTLDLESSEWRWTVCLTVLTSHAISVMKCWRDTRRKMWRKKFEYCTRDDDVCLKTHALTQQQSDSFQSWRDCCLMLFKRIITRYEWEARIFQSLVWNNKSLSYAWDKASLNTNLSVVHKLFFHTKKKKKKKQKTSSHFHFRSRNLLLL